MAGVATGPGSSVGGAGGASVQQQCQSGEALAEWRSSEQVENGITSTSPPYWDSDSDSDGGLKPSALYGKSTWRIDNFSQVNKRELRSNIFEVGGYKWYILIYPQGCDVCNHLSLFLCVAEHDKLLPGWSHFAQFTIAVVNKDPKKSKYSDTLHRFWKKEHDWGWKKFMELSKVLDGFLDGDTLVIKAQVQVIRERAERPFRCLDCNYRRELVRVYLTNVEQLCGRFIEERRTKLVKLIEDKARWSSFCSFWLNMDPNSRRHMSWEKSELILKVVVKHFFIEKEVTSTLVMDSLYSGLKALKGQTKGITSKGNYIDADESPVPIVRIEKDSFVLVEDVLLMLERAAVEPLPPKDEKGPQNRTEDGGAGEEFNKDTLERYERQLTELGRRTIEIFVLAQIFSKIEVSYQEAVALMKQEELIREEAVWLAESEQKAKRGADKEKKSKKKQGKQKRNNRKGKDKGRDDKTSNTVQEQIKQDSRTAEIKDLLAAEAETVHEKTDAVEDVSDVSDSVDCPPEVPPPDSEDTDTSEVIPPTEAVTSDQILGGLEVRSPSAMDDSSSTCSSDSVPSVVLTMPHKGNSRYQKKPKSPSRVKSHQTKLTSETADRDSGEVSQPSEAVTNGRHPNDASRRSKTSGSVSQAAARPLQATVVNGTERHAGKKEEGTYIVRGASSAKNVEVSENKAVHVTSTRTRPYISIPSQKLHSNTTANDPVIIKKPPSDSVKQAHSLNSVINGATLNSEPQKLATPKPAEKPSGNHLPIMSLNSAINGAALNSEPQKLAIPKPAEKPSGNHLPIMRLNSAINGAALNSEPQKLATPKRAEKPSGHQLPIMSEKASKPSGHQSPVMNEKASKPSGHQLPVMSEKASNPSGHQLPIMSEKASKPSGHQLPVMSEMTSKPSGNQLPVMSEKASKQQVPVMSRPLSAPLAPGTRPSVSMVSMVQTAPVLARSASAAGRLGPEPPIPSAAQSYVPQSYRSAITGRPITRSSSAYSQNHPASSGINSSYSYSQPSSIFVSAPPFSSEGSDRLDSQSNISFGMVNHHDMLQNAPIWMERVPDRDLSSLSNDMQRLHLYNPTVTNASRPYLQTEFPAATSGRQSHAAVDEFPHLDIINDLLNDEFRPVIRAGVNSGYQSLSNGFHHLGRQLSLPGEPGLSSIPGQSMSTSGFDRTRSYHDDVYQHGYGPHGSSYDTVRDMTPLANPLPYANGPGLVDGFMPNQWQMTGSEQPYLNVRNTVSDGYTYRMPEYPNHSLGMNGYTVYRPSNGL